MRRSSTNALARPSPTVIDLPAWHHRSLHCSSKRPDGTGRDGTNVGRSVGRLGTETFIKQQIGFRFAERDRGLIDLRLTEENKEDVDGPRCVTEICLTTELYYSISIGYCTYRGCFLRTRIIFAPMATVARKKLMSRKQ